MNWNDSDAESYFDGGDADAEFDDEDDQEENIEGEANVTDEDTQDHEDQSSNENSFEIYDEEQEVFEYETDSDATEIVDSVNEERSPSPEHYFPESPDTPLPASLFPPAPFLTSDAPRVDSPYPFSPYVTSPVVDSPIPFNISRRAANRESNPNASFPQDFRGGDDPFVNEDEDSELGDSDKENQDPRGGQSVRVSLLSFCFGRRCTNYVIGCSGHQTRWTQIGHVS